MVAEHFVPEAGDIIRLNFDPQSGHEQSGWRPGLVISNYTFNNATGFAIVCPITNTNHDYPFHVLIPDEFNVTGVVMVDQVKSLDYLKRKARFITKVSGKLLEEVMAIHTAIFQDDEKS